MVQNLALETVPVSESAALTSGCWKYRGNVHTYNVSAVQIKHSDLDSNFLDRCVVKNIRRRNKAQMKFACENIGSHVSLQTYPIMHNNISFAGSDIGRDLLEPVRRRIAVAVTRFFMMCFGTKILGLSNENKRKVNYNTKTRVKRRLLTMLKKITARHFDLSAEMKKRAEREMDRLNRYFDNIVSAELVLDTERHRHLAELRVNVYNNMITGTGETNDMYSSIAVAVDRVKAQLKKYKGKLKHKKPEEITETIDSLTRPNTDVDEIEV